MSPAVEAAIIAGSVGVLTLIGTLATQYYGIRRTSKDTLNARFATAADKMGSEAPAVRLAGVYAMAGLVDDWPENRQTCVDVLCGYLRMPYASEPAGGPASKDTNWLEWRGFQEVRHTVIRVIAAHLRDGVAVPWRSLELDFTGVIFDGDVNFDRGKFAGKSVSFDGAEFSGKSVSFRQAEFSGKSVSFRQAEFSGESVSFGAEFSGESVSFDVAKFSGEKVSFNGAEFAGE